MVGVECMSSSRVIQNRIEIEKQKEAELFRQRLPEQMQNVAAKIHTLSETYHQLNIKLNNNKINDSFHFLHETSQLQNKIVKKDLVKLFKSIRMLTDNQHKELRNQYMNQFNIIFSQYKMIKNKMIQLENKLQLIHANQLEEKRIESKYDEPQQVNTTQLKQYKSPRVEKDVSSTIAAEKAALDEYKNKYGKTASIDQAIEEQEKALNYFNNRLKK
jgi:hypothetical protein